MASAGDSAVGIPIRGIRMKFAVLAGLLEAGEVSNRDTVETIFNLVDGGVCLPLAIPGCSYVTRGGSNTAVLQLQPHCVLTNTHSLAN
ncbi:putative lipopolysaccharide-responsive and beige-like anchor protein [Triplophysa rosa]|uniref:Lipopolysaccharide-responsive and beige-like anchor protein n=1 Tax=Triplophysa rosa TaxID=992332 RepID=A0A9W7WY71_TRIRA|nr:putative lipopolysaccharide-responsive and beige-like anchor protein [Triplophysa rosa]